MNVYWFILNSDNKKKYWDMINRYRNDIAI